MNSIEIIEALKNLGDSKNREGMARFGINTQNALGIPMPELRRMAKSIKTNHELALSLWSSGLHEARILSVLIADPKQLTLELATAWCGDFDSWDLCDQACMNLFDKADWARQAITIWAEDDREYVRRAAFALIASIGVHHKRASDESFGEYFSLIAKHSHDGRNFVKKAINWALRQIGKRNPELNRQAIDFCETLLEEKQDASTKWIAKSALRELTSENLRIRSIKKPRNE